jgi:hypothetical protein
LAVCSFFISARNTHERVLLDVLMVMVTRTGYKCRHVRREWKKDCGNAAAAKEGHVMSPVDLCYESTCRNASRAIFLKDYSAWGG